MRIYFCAFFLFYSINLIQSQEIESNSFSPFEEAIANPERGFYHHTEVHSHSYSPLILDQLINARVNENITLILRVFYLEAFTKQAISQDYLDNMQKDFNTLRKSGSKAIIRFAYTKDSSAPYGDARPSIVFTHIKQIQHILSLNSDVIAAVQAGFIGAWGEWYYTDHFAGFSPSDVDEENWEDRRTVIKELLKSLPNERMVQIRTPRYKMRVFENSEPLNIDIAFNNSDISRVGHHNDCFVASSSDVGTYTNADIEKPYLEEETKYTVMGGETCGLSPPYSDCENSLNELTRFHWSYLNIDYHGSVLGAWDDQGCFDEIEKRLGYRLILNEASIIKNINPEGEFNLKLNLLNDGFSNPYNSKNVVIKLINQTSKKEYLFYSNEDIRKWPIGEEFEISFTAGLESDFEEGDYNVFISVLDNDPRLENIEEYMIKFSNNDIWDQDYLSHDLGLTLVVSSSTNSVIYNGNDYFSSKTSNSVENQGPIEIWGGNTGEENLIFWGRDSTYSHRVILRSEDSIEFELFDIVKSDLDYFKDYLINSESEYSYKYYLTDFQNNRTVESEIISLSENIENADYPEIVLDGLDPEWSGITPLSSTLDNDLKAHIIKAYFDISHLNFYVYGNHNELAIYLDTDNNMETGMQENNEQRGADYLLLNDLLYSYLNSKWVQLESEISKQESEQGLEIRFPFINLENLGSTTMVPVRVELNNGDQILSGFNANFANLTRNLPPDIPTSFEITNSDDFPESRLELHWTICDHCDHYIIEKSLDGDQFSQIKELTNDKDLYYDDFLENGTYYYRMKTMNRLGYSDYSEIRFGTIGSNSIFDTKTSFSYLNITPNPASDFINLDKQFELIEIYNLDGKLVEKIKHPAKQVSISILENGMYFLKARQKDGAILKGKFIKL